MMLCRPDVLCLFNCVTATTQVNEGSEYFPWKPHVGQPWYRLSPAQAFCFMANYIFFWV